MTLKIKPAGIRASLLLTAVAFLGLQFAAEAALPAITNLTLAWNPVAQAATYTMYWGTSSRNYTFSTSCSALQTNLTSSAVLANQVYYLAVTATDALGNQSVYSSEVVYSPPTYTTTLIWTNPAPIIYGSALSPTQLNAVANVPGSFAYNPTNGTLLNAGTNVISVVFSPTDSLDYSSVTDTVSVVVSPALLTVTAANSARPYGQSNAAFTGTITGLTNGDNIAAIFSSSAATNSPVGTYAVTPGLVDPGNRRTNYTVSLINGMLTVTQARSLVTWANPAPIIYGSALTSNQLNAVANVPGSFAYNPTNGTLLNAGTNVLSVVFAPTNSLDYSSVTDTVSVVVSPALLTVTAANSARPYGQSNAAFTGTITGLKNGDNIAATYGSSATTNSPVGTYAITPGLVDPGNRRTNYSVSLINGMLTVTQARSLVTWASPAPITYGSALTPTQLNAVANVPGSFAYNPTNGTLLNAGTNVLSVVFAPSNSLDYSSVTDTVSVVVSPALLTVTAANAARPFGQSNAAFTGTITGLKNSDNIAATYSSSATTNSPVGTYPITPGLGDPGNRRTNYNVSLINGMLTVTQARSLVTWASPAPITYGSALTPTQLDAVANVPGSFAYNPTNGTVLNAGTNVISVVFSPTDSLDYSSVTNTVSVVISPALLTVIVANAARPFGQSNAAFTGTITGLTNGDNIAATYSSSATNGSPVGTYPITPAFVDPGDRLINYAVSLINGTLTVTQAGSLVTWTNPAPITYGSALTSNQFNAVANVPGSFAYNPTNGTLLNAGTNVLSVVFSPTDSLDYSSVTDTVSVVVTPAMLTVTAANAARPYGQSNAAFTGIIIGLTNSDNIAATYSSSATTNSAVGTYAVTPVLVDPGNRLTNYTVSLINGILTVTQARPLVTWANPAPLIFGSALTPTQLNAVANVPGNFVYNPTNGILLNPGTNALSVVFSPTDSLDYGSVTDTVSVIVVTRLMGMIAMTPTQLSPANRLPNDTGNQVNDKLTAAVNASSPVSNTKPRIDSVDIRALGAGRFRLTIAGNPGQMCAIQFTTNFNTPWQTLQSVATDGLGSLSVDVTSTSSIGWYRVVQR